MQQSMMIKFLGCMNLIFFGRQQSCCFRPCTCHYLTSASFLWIIKHVKGCTLAQAVSCQRGADIHFSNWHLTAWHPASAAWINHPDARKTTFHFLFFNSNIFQSLTMSFTGLTFSWPLYYRGFWFNSCQVWEVKQRSGENVKRRSPEIEKKCFAVLKWILHVQCTTPSCSLQGRTWHWKCLLTTVESACERVTTPPRRAARPAQLWPSPAILYRYWPFTREDQWNRNAASDASHLRCAAGAKVRPDGEGIETNYSRSIFSRAGAISSSNTAGQARRANLVITGAPSEGNQCHLPRYWTCPLLTGSDDGAPWLLISEIFQRKLKGT